MLPRIVTSDLLDALLRLLATPSSVARSSAGLLRCKPPCRPHSGYPLRYGTRYITLPRFLRQAVSFFFLWLSNHLPYHKYISVVATNGSIWSEPKSGNLVERQSIPARYAPLLPFIHLITLLIFCTERGTPSSTRAPRQRTR